MKKSSLYKKIGLFSIICTILLPACGNQKNQTDLSTIETEEVQQIVVYYSNENPFYQSVLEEYQKKEKNILDLHAFETDAELAKQYAAEGLSANGADVLLLGNTSSLDIKELAKENICLDLSEYLEQDVTYQKKNYFEAVMDAGTLDGKQYILPITYDLGFVITRKTVDDLCGNRLINPINCFDFYKELLSCQQILYNSDQIRLGLSVFSNSVEEFLLYVYHTSGLELVNDSTITASKEQIQFLCDFTKAGLAEFQDKYKELKNSGKNSAMLVGYQLYYGNPASILRQQEFAYESLFQESVDYYMIPAETNKGYHATIHDFGFVSAKSKCPKEAYQLIRYFMDYDFYPLGVVYKASVPINRKNFENQFSNLCNITTVTNGNHSQKVSPMSEELYQKLEKQINQIVSARLPQPDIEQIFAETMADHINNLTDFDSCYQQMCHRLELFLKE